MATGCGYEDETKLHVYINGVEQGAGTAQAAAPAYNATSYVRIGCYNAAGSNSQFFNGSMDEIFLSGTALSSDEVLALYNANKATFVHATAHGFTDGQPVRLEGAAYAADPGYIYNATELTYNVGTAADDPTSIIIYWNSSEGTTALYTTHTPSETNQYITETALDAQQLVKSYDAAFGGRSFNVNTTESVVITSPGITLDGTLILVDIYVNSLQIAGSITCPLANLPNIGGVDQTFGTLYIDKIDLTKNLYSANSGGYITGYAGSKDIGINTTGTEDKGLEINAKNGQALRLTYNNADGSAVNYSDFAVSSAGNLTVTPSGDNATIAARIKTKNIEPITDNTYYLGRNDDDSPKAFKGIVLKDTTNDKYYRIEIINGVVTATDLTD